MGSVEERGARMSDRVLGIFRAKRFVLSIPPQVCEFLLFTQSRVVVARQFSRLLPYLAAGANANVDDFLIELLKTLRVEDLLRADKQSFAISHSEIRRVILEKWVCPRGFFDMEVYPRGSTASNVVKLEKSWGPMNLSIVTSEKTYRWTDLELPQKQTGEFEEYENLLRPIFGDTLSVRLAREREEPFE